MVCSVLLVSFCWGKLEFRPCVIVGVQKLMRFVSARLAEKFLIQFDNIRVLVALADRCVGVLAVKRLGTLCL